VHDTGHHQCGGARLADDLAEQIDARRDVRARRRWSQAAQVLRLGIHPQAPDVGRLEPAARGGGVHGGEQLPERWQRRGEARAEVGHERLDSSLGTQRTDRHLGRSVPRNEPAVRIRTGFEADRHRTKPVQRDPGAVERRARRGGSQAGLDPHLAPPAPEGLVPAQLFARDPRSVHCPSYPGQVDEGAQRVIGHVAERRGRADLRVTTTSHRRRADPRETTVSHRAHIGPTMIAMSSAPSVSSSITVRMQVQARPTAVSELTTSIEQSGGIVTALDVTASEHERITVDVTCATRGEEHADDIVSGLRTLEGVVVERVSDRTFLLHLGGKLSIESKVPLRNRDDLSMVYTPGVARICQAIAARPEDARRLTIKRNTIAVVTDGTAVLGLGNLGPLAALPVMEGKAVLFKRFADIDAFPIALDTTDVDQIVETVCAIAPVFAGINLEDISAPRCFEIERRLRERLDIPVFHDDQHGTAIVALAALTNALKVVGKTLPDVRIVMSGAGAAGTAVLTLLLAAGARDVVVADIDGVIYPGRPGLTEQLASTAAITNPRRVTGTLRSALAGADVFIGVSAPDILTGDDVATMAERSIVFAMANPRPEVDPVDAARFAAVVGTGRSDFANQINNVLAFPGVFRGLLNARSHNITDAMLLAASQALASVVSDDELNPTYIVPSVFHPDVTAVVAAAVERVARAEAADAG
jgi:malate dehydrogenase (oxaloacetate-decarboxylating)